MTEKVRENRLRRMAKRQSYKLVKSQIRDPHALGFGCYDLTRPNNTSVFGFGPTGQPKVDLDDIEEFLTSEAEYDAKDKAKEDALYKGD